MTADLAHVVLTTPASPRMPPGPGRQGGALDAADPPPPLHSTVATGAVLLFGAYFLY
jgi:hypothetical protein